MPPDRTDWKRTFWTLCACQCVAMLAFGMATPFLPLYVQSMGVGDARNAARWAGLMSSGGMLVMAAIAPVWGTIADRHGRKPMVTRALFGGGAVVAVMGFARSPEQLLALRLVQGLFSGTVSATRTLVTSVAPAEQLGYVLGMMQTAAFLGNTAGPLVGGVIADHVGYGPSFVVTGVLLTATGVAVLRLVQEDFSRPAVTEPGARGLVAAWRLVAGSPGLLALIATLFFVQAGMSAVQPVLPLFVGELAGNGAGVATLSGLMLGAGAATGALAAGFAGRVGDRLGHTRVVGGCALLGALFYLPQALVHAPWQLLALRALQGTFTGGLIPGVMAIIAVGTPVERRGLIFGLTATATSLGSAAGPAAGAAVASVFGLRGAFVVTAAVLSLAGVWVITALRPSGEAGRARSRPGAAESPAAG
ncbi:MAG TPA: MFS transporter [Chloroflexota bacterium]|nr:MFS transporter [Chloroflexota bacterium]